MPKQQQVLIVDDDESVRDFVSKALRQYGYDAASASNGRIALNLLEEYHPDLILLDIMMPELSGIEVLKLLHDCGNTTPVIILTGLKDTELLEQAFSLGALDYITKPFVASVLVARIRAKLRRVSISNISNDEAEQRKQD